MKTKIAAYNRIPKTAEIFGRIVITDRKEVLPNVYGEARYGQNTIGIAETLTDGCKVSDEEKKITYLHELLHFILMFTGFDNLLRTKQKIDIEQFVELLAAGIYQYEKSATF